MARTFASSNLYLNCCRQNHSFLSPSRFSPSPSSHFHPQTLFFAKNLCRCIAAVPLGPPTPPSPDPPPPKNTTELANLVGVASMVKDRVKIFLAVLIWISLFFWASALEGRGRGNGKGKNRSRFK